MSFVSYNFVAFIFCVLVVYYIVPKKWQWIVLLCGSYYFYLLTGVQFLSYILFTTVSTYLCAIMISRMRSKQVEYLKSNKENLTKEDKKAYKAKVKKQQKIFLMLGLLSNFGILAFLKYINFIIANINLFRLTHFGSLDFIGFFRVMLPLGISFYTFQAMGYLIDIYFGKYQEEKNFGKFALFVSFFPQIIQGPISRFDQLAAQFSTEKPFLFYNIKNGFYRIMWGLFKKLIIADKVAPYVKTVTDMYVDYPGIYILFAIFFYAMQIYGDFSGGIDIAIGVAEMLGIHITANFERPFFSKSIAEYWRRWHITLGTWFKDYIFYPLSISRTFINLGKWVRKNINDSLGKKIPIYLAMLIVWFTTGLWHGAEWKYIIWGLLNCLLIIMSTEFEPIAGKLIKRFRIHTESFWWKCFRILRTFWLMAFLRVFDFAKDAKTAVEIIKSSVIKLTSFNWETFFTLGLEKEEFIVACIGCIILFAVSFIQRKGGIRERLFRQHTVLQWVALGALIIVVLVFGTYGYGYDSADFIYLQF